jgi:hypothetical protein
MSPVDIAYARFASEEGRRAFAYNDATSKRVTCQPGGNLSIGMGINLEVGLDDEEIDWLSKHRLQKVADQLAPYPWYQGCDSVRQSVLLDMAFNQKGVMSLLHYPHMLAAILRKDWESASAECHVEDPKLDVSRYEPLRQLMLVGGDS